jgi:lipoic acid synthetase
MIGLGEAEEDILEAFADLRQAGCDLLTLGQYLQPAAVNPPVERYYAPGEFEALRTKALELGFREVVAGPLVRSSFEAERLYGTVQER